MKFTPKQIENYKHYLDLCVSEGELDESEAQAIIDKEDWEAVDYMMARGDDWANDNEKT